MVREPRDRTVEVKTIAGMPEIGRSDFCDAFEHDTDRLFYCRECWYCKYGEFGIFSEHPTQHGVCRFKKSTVLTRLNTTP